MQARHILPIELQLFTLHHVREQLDKVTSVRVRVDPESSSQDPCTLNGQQQLGVGLILPSFWVDFKLLFPVHETLPSALTFRSVVCTEVAFSSGVMFPKSRWCMRSDVDQSHVLFHVKEPNFLIQKEIL